MVVLTTITWLVAKAAVIVPPNPVAKDPMECVPCGIAKCVDQKNCRGGTARDQCGCCIICLKVKGNILFEFGKLTAPYRNHISTNSFVRIESFSYG